jgi:hypothetical protein
LPGHTLSPAKTKGIDKYVLLDKKETGKSYRTTMMTVVLSGD